MHVKIENISIEDINYKDALELKNEILKATKGEIHFDNKYPALKRLLMLLQGSFENSTKGVHFVD